MKKTASKKSAVQAKTQSSQAQESKTEEQQHMQAQEQTKGTNTLVIIIAIAVVLLLIAGAFALYIVAPRAPLQPIQEDVVKQEVQQEPEYVEREIVEEFSFEQYTSQADKFHETEITIRGMPSYVFEDTRGRGQGALVSWLTDDKGNKISISGLNNEELYLFKESKEGDVFEVTGTFDKFGFYNAPDIAARTVQTSERKTEIVKELKEEMQ